ncbi:dTDP-4-dehydrorhamnose reductase [Sinorhizobium numidicum]|uniref:dTDP-4-dehydrorhamnose reductase n=1 Tax=Sinorhizobium numidicum TaxID=680248 RepID=A0ABY8CR35_9HYPH|nr:dTDP-4-dehydrorhamnose reductase [Sinorhizobium numidicum]WEX75116.1 dTDP-4-dehydrorhamnose reductase [Sinorhizobium numidicum]WEX81110.1 dTDP-4-dehydrorhamnose reductase [Sinorhizobium numidicum]
MSGTKKKMVVTGTEGQVARSLLERARSIEDLDLVALGRPRLDLADLSSIAKSLISEKPDVIVSAAAYTSVDKAEEDSEAAFKVNGHAPGEIARVAADLNIPLVHISTDYVFDGGKNEAYTEGDITAPAGVYGHSKLLGEQTVREHTTNHVILRTAWVYSPFGKNFLLTMLRLAEGRDVINVVDDQIGNPTCALALADGILTVARNLISSDAPELRGVFHAAGSGSASWADFAAYIFETSRRYGGPFAEVQRIPTSAYPTPARRPANSRLDCAKLEAAHGVLLPFWKQCTEMIVRRLLVDR